MKLKKLLILPLCSLAMAGCGGSDDESPAKVDPTQDTTPPIITLTNGSEIKVEVNTDFVDPGYSVSDDTDDNVSVSINSNVDNTVLGSYTITYSATDSAGNSAEVTRTVIVVDTTAPIITLLNSKPLTLEQGTEYREYGALAVDNYDNEVEVVISNNIDLAHSGEYTVIYSASDSSNNIATVEKQITVSPSKVTVTIDSFGDGAVELLDNESPLICSDSNICTVEVDQGAAIALKATATNNWQFLSWRGCETAQDVSVCKLTPQADTSLSLTFSPNESGVDLTLADNVVVLNTQQKVSIRDYNETTGVITFDGSADLSKVVIGSILVSNGIDKGNGLENFFLKRVVEVLGNQGSLRVIKTEEATLDQLITEGAIVYQQALTAENVQQSSLPQGIKVLSKQQSSQEYNQVASITPIEFAVTNLILHDADGDIGTKDDQISATGAIKLKVNPDFSLKVDFPATISHFRSVAYIDIESELGLDIGGPMSIGGLKKDVTLPIRFTPITLGIIVIQPEVQLSLVADASVGVTVKPRLVAKLDIVAGAQYTKSKGFESIKGLDFNVDANDPFTTIELKAEAKAGPEIAYFSRLYGIAGPGVGNSLKLGIEAIPLLNNNNCVFDVNTFLELDINYKGSFRLITKKFDYSSSLFKFKKQIDSLSRSCGSSALNAPTDLMITTTGSESFIVDWNAIDSDADISYKIYKDSVFLENGIYESQYEDSNVIANTQHCYFVIAEDDLGNESPASNEVCAIVEALDVTDPTAPTQLSAEPLSSTAIELTWSGATDNTGVEGYTVYAYNGGTPYAKQVSVESTATILQLSPDTEYCYSVAAFDARGNRSELSQSSCATTNTKEESEWSMYIACTGREYVVEEQFDLDQNLTSEVFVFGEAQDYSGAHMNYSLFGVYTDTSGNLNGEINWSFDNTNNLRKDEFIVDLSTGDTGDVAMNQTLVTGCDAVIRFVSSKKQTPANIPESRSIQNNDLGETISGLGYQ